ITELKPQHLQEMESYSISFLPKGFTYYAGGHVHIVQRYEEKGYSNLVYPGPLFPNSFSELERLEHGGYYLYDHGKVTRHDIKLKDVERLRLTANSDAEKVNEHLQEAARELKVQNKIILIRIEGTLLSGNINSIDIRKAVQVMEERGAYIVLRNTT